MSQCAYPNIIACLLAEQATSRRPEGKRAPTSTGAISEGLQLAPPISPPRCRPGGIRARGVAHVAPPKLVR